MKVLIYVLLSCISVVLISNNVLARPVQGESILCKNKNRITMIAFSTSDYNIAICKDFGDAYYYTGQHRRNNTQTFLPITEINNPYTGANPWLLKAHNGEFTYQVAEFNPLSNGSYVSISVFRNGNRIYHRITDKYISAGE